MAVSPNRGAIGILIAGSMVFGSTAAAAAIPSTPAYQPDPWAVLSVMNGGASAVAVCGASAASVAATAAATQAPPGGGCVLPQVDVPAAAATGGPPQPIPVPPIEAAGGGFAINPLYLALLAIAGGVGLYLVLHHHHGNSST